MRKVLLIMTLLLAMVTQGAWAQTTTYTSYTVTGGSVSYWSSCEHDKLLDNNTGTKWCTVFGNGSTATATCGEWVEFNTTHAIIPTGYILTTCDDTNTHYGRNPKNWTLKGKLNVGDAWTVLTDVTNASMPQTNHTDKSFDISNTDRAYKYFRFEINAIDGSTYNIEVNPQMYKFQLSRLLLKGTDAMFDASFATGSGGTGWSISPTSATDGTTVTVSYTGQHRVKSVTVVPKGALTGKFSVSSTKQVQFSKGNLQAVFASAGTSCTWQFADHQYDYVGNTAANTVVNGNGSVSAAGVVDHFGWSTSANYYGINPSTDTNSYQGDFVDWGQNTITNGCTGWRTLTKDEWGYLFTDRANASTLRTFATVNNVKGLIVMPDGWTASGVSLTITTANYTTNNLSTSQWATLEKQGCVFLPTAGYRAGTAVNGVGTRGDYWSSTTYNANHGYDVHFDTGGVRPQSYSNRIFGLSVRLVRDVE